MVPSMPCSRKLALGLFVCVFRLMECLLCLCVLFPNGNPYLPVETRGGGGGCSEGALSVSLLLENWCESFYSSFRRLPSGVFSLIIVFLVVSTYSTYKHMSDLRTIRTYFRPCEE